MEDSKPSLVKTAESTREEAFFEAAVALPIEQRAAYLDRVCAGDAALRQRLEVLLKSNDKAEADFLPAANSTTAAAQTVTVQFPSDEKAGDVIGRYKIREKIGEGGCGVVYVAEQAEPVRRRVALKIIKLGMDTRSVIARFEAERQALAMMDHPNIAKVLDAGSTESGRPFFIMELVRGIKITDYCDQNHLDTAQRLELFVQVCHAVQHAHQKGVIHRDIKPSNILVTLHDGKPVPKVIDFGIAKATEGRLTDLTVYTELHQFIGTPAYMSPEQAEMSGLDIDTRSDIYSLGVLLYELLTGRTPFDPQALLKAGLDEMRRTIREEEPLRPSTRLSTLMNADLTSVAKRHGSDGPQLLHFIRGDLDWIVMKALEKDRTRRFETANELASDVQRFLHNEPVEACPPSSVYRLRKLVRRNKGVFIGTGAVIVALVLGFGLSLYLYLREADLRLQAEKGWALEKHMRELAPLSEKFTAAGYLLSQGDFEKAEQVMEEVPPIVPQSSAIYNVLGDQHARHGEWAAALKNYDRSVQADPTNHFAYHLLTPLLVEINDLQRYEQHREKILARFAASSDPTIAERLGRDCLLLPASANQLKLISRMADTAVSSGPGDNGWIKFVKGFVEFRQGSFTEAAKWLQETRVRAKDPALKLQTEMVLAMAQYKLGQLATAQKTLNEGLEFGKAQVPERDGLNWNDRRSAWLLTKEAKALIAGASAAQDGVK